MLSHIFLIPENCDIIKETHRTQRAKCVLEVCKHFIAKYQHLITAHDIQNFEKHTFLYLEIFQILTIQ